jgi:CubicO group peptidase (beta-lactamase class C family)
MKRSSLILALSCIFFQFADAQQTAGKEIAAAFDKVLEQQFKPGETGAVALVSKNGKIIYKRATGMANLELNVPMETNNIFRIGSITKQFTAVAILQLAEKGKLSLQDEITKFIPGFPEEGNKITIEHLLTHTSGIRNFSNIKDNEKRTRTDYTPEEMISYFKDQPLRFPSGTKWEYSNTGYFLLGYIIEQITGNSYAQYLRENFFGPLGMNNSSYVCDSTVVKNRAAGYTNGSKGFENAAYISMTQPFSAGAIQSTAEDLFKWNQAIQSNSLVKKETLDKAFTRYKLRDGSETSYGYGWRMGFIQGSPSLWHGGSINGFMSMAMYLPKEDVYVTVLSNCDCKSPEDVTAKLAAIAIGKPYDHKSMQVKKDVLQAYTAVYENEKGQQTIISFSENQLYLQFGRGKNLKINAFQQDQFFLTDGQLLTLEFCRNKNNALDRLVIHSRTANEVWTKTNKSVNPEVAIKPDEKTLDSYVGEYEVSPEFHFSISREQDRLFLKATGQERIEIFPEAINKFYIKENGAQLEFVKDNSGKIVKAILTQGNRQTDAMKIIH